MTEFSARTSTISGFAGVLGEGGNHIDLAAAFSRTANQYVTEYSRLDAGAAGSQLWQDICANNTQVVSALLTATTSIGTLLEESGRALAVSASRYATLDQAAAARLDASYPGGDTTVPDSGSASTTASLVDPEPELEEEPAEGAPIPDMVQWIMDKGGWVSITGMAMRLASLFGLDPAAEITKSCVGDYEALGRAGNAAGALSSFASIAADTLASGAAAMDWTGNAADAAEAWFLDMADAIAHHAEQLGHLREKYELLAQFIAELASALGLLLSAAGDQLLILAADIAAAGCLAEVPGINVIIALVGAYEVWRTKEAVEAFIRVCDWVYRGVTGLLAAVTGLAGWAESSDVTARLPSAPYANASFA